MEPLTSHSSTTRVFLMRRFRATSSITSPPYLMLRRMVPRGSISVPRRARFLRRLTWVAILEAMRRMAWVTARLSSMPISLKSFSFSCSLGL